MRMKKRDGKKEGDVETVRNVIMNMCELKQIFGI